MYSKENPSTQLAGGTKVYGKKEGAVYGVEDMYLIETLGGSREIGSRSLEHFELGDSHVYRLARFLDMYQEIPVPSHVRARYRHSISIDLLRYSDPVIATYLRIVMLMSNQEVGEVMDIAESTVSQYKSDVMNGRRE